MQVWYGTSAWADPVGTRRRLQALTAAGWSTSQLAERLGVSKSAIASLRSTGQSRVLAATAVDVAALYEGCWWRTPPGRYQTRAERYAEARGWSGPWCWEGSDLDDPNAVPRMSVNLVDLVAVTRLVEGRSVGLSRADRGIHLRAAVIELERRGLSAAQIAARVGLSARTIQRYRSDTRATAA